MCWTSRINMHSALIHYRPWPQYQQMLLEQYPYYQLVTHDMHLQYSMNDHQEENYEQSRDEMPSEASDDQNHNADMFRLAFAASSWSKLVLNAEGLFNKLMSTNALPSNEQNLLKNQIEQWLCMKQEYEECIVGDESVSLHGYTENTRRSLERIEEVTETTETDEKTDESNNWARKQLHVRNKNCSSSSLNTSSKSETYETTPDVTDDSDESDVDSENSDFIDKLEESMKQFEIDTDNVVNSMKNGTLKSNDIFPGIYCSKSKNSISENDFNSRSNSPEPHSVCNNFITSVKLSSMSKQSARRASILPNSEMSIELAEFQKRNCQKQLNNNINLQQNNNHDLISFNSNKKTEAYPENNQNCAETLNINVKSENIKVESSLAIDCQHLNTLKTLRIDIIEKQSKVKKIQFNIDLLRKQIVELESAIQRRELFIEEIKQNSAARNTAKQKYREWQSKYEEKYRKYEKLLYCKKSQRNVGDIWSYQEEMDKYKQLLKRYEKKVKDIKNLKQIVDNSAKTLTFSKAAVNKFRKEMEVLKLQLNNEEKYKEELGIEIAECQKRVKQLEDVYNLTPANLKKILSVSEDGKNHRIIVKSDTNECSTETNIKSFCVNDSIREKSNCKNDDDVDEKESLRKEIRELRHIRDLLIKMQCDLSTVKMTPTTKIERHVLHVSEYIECIDAMMEEKNVMICSKADLNQNRSNKLDDNIPVFNRLEKLSHKELVTLIYKYIYKVVDLKESSQELEINNAKMEGDFKSLQMDYEKKLLDFQTTYEKHITMLLSCYPDESSSSVCESKIDRSREIAHLLKENHSLKQRIANYESLIKFDKSALTQAIQPHSIRNTKPVFKPSHQLMHAGPSQKATVFREGNKLVFQK
ncbi:kinesin-like protein costa [Phymastichus coffea]|uniref:kinesin-like protein costa n=1 Tax=Phymastichus coffea TaxID=108790 RepID=UPI00273B399F|nr:kinesin-like protein costa [Phymastichus coffea]